MRQCYYRRCKLRGRLQTELTILCREMSIQWVTKDAVAPEVIVLYGIGAGGAAVPVDRLLSCATIHVVQVYWGTEPGKYSSVAAGTSTSYTRQGKLRSASSPSSAAAARIVYQ